MLLKRVTDYCRLGICGHKGPDVCIEVLSEEFYLLNIRATKQEEEISLACTMLEEYGIRDSGSLNHSPKLHKRIQVLGIMRGDARVKVAEQECEISLLKRRVNMLNDIWMGSLRDSSVLRGRVIDLSATVEQQAEFIEGLDMTDPIREEED